MNKEVEVVVSRTPWAMAWWQAEVVPLIDSGLVTSLENFIRKRVLVIKPRAARYAPDPESADGESHLLVTFTEEEITWLTLKYA